MLVVFVFAASVGVHVLHGGGVAVDLFRAVARLRGDGPGQRRLGRRRTHLGYIPSLVEQDVGGFRLKMDIF